MHIKNDMLIRREIMLLRWVQHETIGYNMKRKFIRLDLERWEACKVTEDDVMLKKWIYMFSFFSTIENEIFSYVISKSFDSII